MHDDIEESLRAAMREQTAHLAVPAGLARTALRQAKRRGRVQQAASVTAAVAVAGAGVTGGVWAHGRTTRGSAGGASTLAGGTLAGPASSASPTASCYDTTSPTPYVIASPSAGSVTAGSAAPGSSSQPSKAARPAKTAPVVAGPVAGSGAPSAGEPAAGSASAAIGGVRLPDPAPGFSLRRGTDSVDPTGIGDGTYWTATFLVAEKPGLTSTPAPGIVEVEPTGPEATVLVSDGHPFALSSSPSEIDGIPVTGTVTVHGYRGYVTRTCDQTDIYFTSGRFDVLLAGFGTNDAQLVALGNAIEGLQ